MIAVTVAVTLSLSSGKGDDKAGPGGSSSAAGSDVASAGDVGPATVITEDPTCDALRAVNKARLDSQHERDWQDHDYKVPVSEWTPELRQLYEKHSKIMSADADDTVALAKRTPHRVMRELFEQSIAYSRAFVQSLDTYTEKDNYLAFVGQSTMIAGVYACFAIEYKSAAEQAPYVPDVAPPAEVPKPADPSNPQRFMPSPDEDCGKWKSLWDKFNADVKPWGDLDPSITADKWNADQHALIDAAIPVMKKYADDVEKLGRASKNPAITDFAVFGAQYWRAYVHSLPTYDGGADSYLTQAASRPISLIVRACQALGAA